jgi:GNAT superfamily N-acetyltransferase
MIEIPFKNFLIGRIEIRSAVEDIKPLHAAHYVETEKYKLRHKAGFNYEHMASCQEAGMMHAFGARLVDSQQLIAYLFVYVTPSTHDSSLVASDDGYYVVPEYRGSGLGRRLLQYSEKRLKELGVDYFFMSSKAPAGGANIGLFLETEGFELNALSYVKVL